MSKTTLPPFALAIAMALRCAASVLGREKCVPVTTIGARRGDERLVDIVFVERHVGAIVAIEDHRRDALVFSTDEEDERGQPLRVGDDAVRRRRLRAPAARG